MHRLFSIPALLAGMWSMLASLPCHGDTPLDKLSIVEQTWRREGGLLVADITFRNGNAFGLKGVIVTCEIKGDKARAYDSPGVSVRPVLAPGDTKVPGLEFPTIDHKAQGGACHPISAQRN